MALPQRCKSLCRASLRCQDASSRALERLIHITSNRIVWHSFIFGYVQIAISQSFATQGFSTWASTSSAKFEFFARQPGIQKQCECEPMAKPRLGACKAPCCQTNLTGKLDEIESCLIVSFETAILPHFPNVWPSLQSLAYKYVLQIGVTMRTKVFWLNSLTYHNSAIHSFERLDNQSCPCCRWCTFTMRCASYCQMSCRSAMLKLRSLVEQHSPRRKTRWIHTSLIQIHMPVLWKEGNSEYFYELCVSFLMKQQSW